MKNYFFRFASLAILIVYFGTGGTNFQTFPKTGSATPGPDTPTPMPSLSITLGTVNTSQGIALDQGGDVDTQVETKGSPPVEIRRSGNNGVIPAADGNSIPDSYLQFNVDDLQLFAGKPSSHIRLEVDFFDAGKDSFSLQYDALSGKFAGNSTTWKANTNTFKTAVFYLCDAFFGNRDNGADFRISDNGDGAEFIRAVRIIILPASTQKVTIDDYGANPFDDKPDSTPIQAALDSSCSGSRIVFTSGVDSPGYKGYLIDKTLFLTGLSAKQDLIFTSNDPNNHARLQATADLKGYVMQLYARSRFNNAGDIDNIDFGNIDVNGGRDIRKCAGADNRSDGRGDNWGSWLPECVNADDPWCLPGNISMSGGYAPNDGAQNYQGNPSAWTTNVVVHDVVDQQTECGSALAFFSAAGTIQNVTIDTAGDHVHETGCLHTDNDSDFGGWSDGITLFGPAQTVKQNTIINPSDVGIVFFGGRNTIISNNIVKITEGNYGAFAGIAVHPWILGDISGTQVIGNNVSSAGDKKCGGMHAGINLGPQMWGGACVDSSSSAMFGNRGTCSVHPSQDKVESCTGGRCQLWAYLPAGSIFTLKDNLVSAAQINFLVEGFDNLGQFMDENNISQMPQLSDWHAAKIGCEGVRWGALDKVAHDPILPGYKDLMIHCER